MLRKILHKIKDWIDEFAYLFFLQLALLTLTGLDYIIHNWLYHYGLKFSYEWAVPYWTLLTAIFWILALIGVSAYYIDRHRPNKLKSFGVFITILAEYYSGLLDTLWFLIYKLAGHQIDWTKNWWYHPYSTWFGHWDLKMNIVLNIFTLVLLAILWIYIKKKD